MTEKTEKPRISGKEATHVAMEAQKYGPVRIGATDDSTPNSDEPADEAQVPAQVNGTPDSGHARKAPPRVRKLSPLHDNTWRLRRTWRAIALGSEKPSATPCPTSS